MIEFITFHQIKLNKNNIGIQVLFALNENIKIGVEECSSTGLRNPKNPNQISINTNPNINPSQYIKFNTTSDAYTTIREYILSEFGIESEDDDITDMKLKYKDLYFYIYEDYDSLSKAKLRGVLYASTSSIKPAYFIALTKPLENEYDKELYKKY